MTSRPVASIARAPAPAASPVPISTTVPSRTRTSASNRPSEVTTVPPLMRTSCAARPGANAPAARRPADRRVGRFSGRVMASSLGGGSAPTHTIAGSVAPPPAGAGRVPVGDPHREQLFMIGPSAHPPGMKVRAGMLRPRVAGTVWDAGGASRHSPPQLRFGRDRSHSPGWRGCASVHPGSQRTACGRAVPAEARRSKPWVSPPRLSGGPRWEPCLTGWGGEVRSAERCACRSGDRRSWPACDHRY